MARLSLPFQALKYLQLRGTPAELPHWPSLLPILLALDVLLSSVLYAMLGQPHGFQYAVLADLLHLVLLGGVLWLRSRSARFVQSAIALLLVGLVLGLMLLPPILVLVLSGVDVQLGAADGVGTRFGLLFLQLVWISLLVWRLLAEGQLLRHALDLPFVAGTVIALVMLIIELWVLQAAFTPS